MSYTDFGWDDAPATYRPGQPAPAGSDNAELTAARMEAFGGHVHDGAVAAATATITAKADLVNGTVPFSQLAGIEPNITRYSMPAGDTTHPLLDSAISAHQAAMAAGTPIKIPAGHFQLDTHFDGTAGWPLRGDGANSTFIHAPHLTTGVILALPADMESGGFTLIGPGVDGAGGNVLVANAASAPACVGVNCGDFTRLRDVKVSACGQGIEGDGHHLSLTDVSSKDNLDNLFVNNAGHSFDVGRTNNSGNWSFNGICDFTGAGRASVRISGNKPFTDSKTAGQVHTGSARFGIMLDAKTTVEGAIVRCDLSQWSFESCGEAYIGDDDGNWDAASGRLLAGVRWNMPLCGPFDANYTASGKTTGGYMVRARRITGWTILGSGSDDDTDHSFGDAAGFYSNEFRRIMWTNADHAIRASLSSGKRLFNYGAGAFGCSNVRLTMGGASDGTGEGWRFIVQRAANDITQGRLVDLAWVALEEQTGDQVDQGGTTTGVVFGVAWGDPAAGSPQVVAHTGDLFLIATCGEMDGANSGLVAAGNAAALDSAMLGISHDPSNSGYVQKLVAGYQSIGTALAGAGGGPPAQLAWIVRSPLDMAGAA